MEDAEHCGKDQMCAPLAERTDPDAAKGFKSYFTINRTSNETRFFGVAYKTSRKDKGLMLNVCPFCRGLPGNFHRD